MRQSLNQLERAFVEQIEAEKDVAQEVQRDVALRSRQRELDRTHRGGTARFWALVFVLVATAVVVTLVMFQALLWVMG